MTIYILDVDGESWIEGAPAQGQKFKKVNEKGGELISYYSEPVEPEPEKKLSKLKFKQRMTAAERIGIRAAGELDPVIFDFMDLQKDATYIDLSLPETIQGVQYLEAKGHLVAGRASEILDTPVSEAERYNS